ncbi:MAG: hypothetical protein AAF203_00660 [Pseudomonadota bacterium]
MKVLFFMLVTFSGLNAWALQDLSFQGSLGFDRGAVNIGGDVDYQIKREHTVGGYFILGTEKDNARNQFWSMGGDVKVFFGPDLWKLYLAPGVGIASFDLANGDSEMTFGSIFKIGALIEINLDMYLGLELMTYQNWFSDKAPAGFEVMNATFRIDF